MAHQITNSTASLAKFKQLTHFLEKASRLAREISQGKEFELGIPQLKRPNRVPKDQEWFWTEEWQRGERAVNEDLAAGRYKEFSGADDLIADLHSHL